MRSAETTRHDMTRVAANSAAEVDPTRVALEGLAMLLAEVYVERMAAPSNDHCAAAEA